MTTLWNEDRLGERPAEPLGGFSHNPFGLRVSAPLLAEQTPKNRFQRSLLITLKQSQFAFTVGTICTTKSSQTSKALATWEGEVPGA